MKKPCVNNPNYTFTGKEYSPYGLGYVAESEQIGSIMEGRDKTMWMVGVKNGVKVWNRVPAELTKDAPVITKETAESKTEVPQSDNKVVQPAAAPAKKAPAKRKPKAKVVADDTTQVTEAVDTEPVVAEPVVAEPVVAEPVVAEPVVTEEVTPVVPVVVEPIKKKRAPAKKKPAQQKPESEVVPVADTALAAPAAPAAHAAAAAAPPVKKPPTKFNVFMKYRLVTMGKEHPEMTHQEKWSACASEWKTLTKEQQEAIVALANAS